MTTRRRARRSILLPLNLVGSIKQVHVAYEACGFGYGLYRALLEAGASCYVIAPQKLDEANTRVKTDGRDSHALCLRLDRYLAGNKLSGP